MLRYSLFTPEPGPLVQQLEAHPGLELLRVFPEFPAREGWWEHVRTDGPHLVLFDLKGGLDGILEAAQLLRGQESPQVVAVGQYLDPQTLVMLLSHGVSDVLQFPFEEGKLERVLQQVRDGSGLTRMELEPTDLLFSFLPAKPGVGCSTALIHTALELSQRPDSRVLLADFDLNCGLSRFFLKIGNPLGVRDALANVYEIDQGLWDDIRSSVEDLHVLAASEIDTRLSLDPARVRMLLDFLKGHYRLVLTDLSGMMEEYSVGILEQAQRILLVVEPDLATVYMAREKMRFLESRGLSERVLLVVNRWRENAPLKTGEIESVLEARVGAILSDAPEQMVQSTLRGGALDPATTYSRQISHLATLLQKEAKRPRHGVEGRRGASGPKPYPLTVVGGVRHNQFDR